MLVLDLVDRSRDERLVPQRHPSVAVGVDRDVGRIAVLMPAVARRPPDAALCAGVRKPLCTSNATSLRRIASSACESRARAPILANTSSSLSSRRGLSATYFGQTSACESCVMKSPSRRCVLTLQVDVGRRRPRRNPSG